MKLNLGLAAALAGFAAAAQQPAQVWLQTTTPTTSSASISANLARLIFKQRMLPFGHGPSSRDGVQDEKLEDVVAALNKFGKKAPTDERSRMDPWQLLVVMENLDEQQMKVVAGKIEKNNKALKPVFEIPNSPAGEDGILDMDLYNVWVETKAKCSNAELGDILAQKCWNPLRRANLVRINMEHYGAFKDTQDMLEQIKAHSERKDLLNENFLSIEVMLVATPRYDDVADNQDSDLRRRQATEQVMATAEVKQEDPVVEPKISPAEDKTFVMSAHVKAADIKNCYESEDACVAATGNCTGHGACQNKYGSDKNACFACHCLGTKSESGSFTQWAGATCSKKDVSAPFWLFFGFTILLMGILSLAIGMLYNVGEEKLPGVIGAGVSGKAAQK